MFIETNFAIEEYIHNLISFHLYPECILRLGQTDHYAFRDARVVVERVGNPFCSGKAALSYRFHVAGPGFAACLLGVWANEDQATASVRVISLTPDDEETREAFREWLAENVDGKRRPPDSFAGLQLV